MWIDNVASREALSHRCDIHGTWGYLCLQWGQETPGIPDMLGLLHIAQKLGNFLTD
jgi:hypothetical protein